MSIALLDSVRRAEGAYGVDNYLSEKLCYMPQAKPRKSPIRTEDAIANVRKAIDHYLREEQPFSVKELCEWANVSQSWLYRKGDPIIEALAQDVRESLKIVGKSKQRRRLQALPPEPEQDTDAIARQWIDRQIERHESQLKDAKAKCVEIERQQDFERRKMAALEEELSHLYKVRELTEATADDPGAMDA